MQFECQGLYVVWKGGVAQTRKSQKAETPSG